MAYYESEPVSFNNNNQSTEKSIKSCYAVVYELENRKWVVAGEGGWSEVHLCEDSLDDSHRILAWTVKSQQVLMNCNVTSDCQYKEKSKNFHSFSDENGNRYGLGFHKSESGLKQATHFLKSVISVITSYKEITSNPPQPPSQPSQPPQPSQPYHAPQQSKTSTASISDDYTASTQQTQSSQPGGMPPPNPYQQHQNQNQNQNQYEANKPQPPPMFSQANDNNNNNGYNNNNQQNQYNQYNQYNNSNNQQQQQPQPPPAQPMQTKYNQYNNNNNNNNNNIQKSASPAPQQQQEQQYLSPNASSGSLQNVENGIPNQQNQQNQQNNFQPTYHLTKEQHKSIPTVPLGPLGNLKILPPKQQKHFSGDKKIKNPTAVEHKMRVTHDKETGLYSGLPKEWLEHLNKQFGVNPKLLPGQQLNQYQSKIPKVLCTLRSALEDANGYQQVGIFRLAPNASDNKAFKEKIDKGQLNENEEKVDVNVYANLIKVWFRDLPDPLLNCINPDLIEHVSNQQDAENVINAFPEPNKSIFLWLCDMCVDIAKYEKINKMGAQNLAIVVGPNLFNTDKFENPMKAMTYSGKVVEFVKHCILSRQQINQ